MYPDSALSAGQLAIMAVVVAAALAAWLVLVFLAAREPRGRSASVNAEHGSEAVDSTIAQLPARARPGGREAA